MGIVIGNIAANPNTLHAALAHYEAGKLQSFCIPWLPSACLVNALRYCPGLHRAAMRLGRRVFPPLDKAPRIEDPLGEGFRLLLRILKRETERLNGRAAQWLSRKMIQQCRRREATGVHAYEDYALDALEHARGLGKVCIYDMPAAYFGRRLTISAELARRYPDWLPGNWAQIMTEERLGRKQREMALADVVLAPSSFVADTVREAFPKKDVRIAAYGVDSAYWRPRLAKNWEGPLTFGFVGQIGLGKGIPTLLEAWNKAQLRDARLNLMGAWSVDEGKKRNLPRNVFHYQHRSREDVREFLLETHVFVFPSFSEGLSLALLEAMACGLPALTTVNSGAADLISPDCGWLYVPSDVDHLIELLREVKRNREKLPQMGRASRQLMEGQTWERYRQSVRNSCSEFY
jgi:alpha-maltose-1-phosphate synthase